MDRRVMVRQGQIAEEGEGGNSELLERCVPGALLRSGRSGCFWAIEADE
jgi:hypothetical protein